MRGANFIGRVGGLSAGVAVTRIVRLVLHHRQKSDQMAWASRRLTTTQLLRNIVGGAGTSKQWLTSGLGFGLAQGFAKVFAGFEPGGDSEVPVGDISLWVGLGGGDQRFEVSEAAPGSAQGQLLTNATAVH